MPCDILLLVLFTVRVKQFVSTLTSIKSFPNNVPTTCLIVSS
ncbi:hypothetical protein AB89_3685 [Escherichia coli 2-316-03_S3_C1]|nr:hypothetical protein AB89_3685 [Escherichia coli 2-316-03_S3_C1]